MADDLLDIITSGGTVTPEDISKNTDGIKTVTEGLDVSNIERRSSNG